MTSILTTSPYVSYDRKVQVISVLPQHGIKPPVSYNNILVGYSEKKKLKVWCISQISIPYNILYTCYV